ncbi:MAG: GntP family permease [Agarilytica sp.]
MLSMIGLVGGLLLLMYLTLRGMNLFLAAPLCALVVGLSGDISIFSVATNDSFVQGYMAGFSSFIRSWFFMFLLGSLFGKLMEHTGAADSIANWIIGKVGKKHAAFAVIASCAVLTYGGVSVFIVAFSVYPMALSLFRDANIPHRFAPAVLAFGSVTFTMTSAGSPEIQNWIPIKYLGTTPFAAWEVSAIVAVVMAVSGFMWLQHMIKKAQANGEKFELTPQQAKQHKHLTDECIAALPHPILGIIPLFVVLGCSFFLHDTLQQDALIVALLGGCIALALIGFRYVEDLNGMISDGTTGALLAIGNTAAVVGFGSVAKLSPAFGVIVSTMTGLEGNELISAAIAITAVAGLTGSASGGQTIALPELAPHYLENGVDPEHLHRITAIASGALDTMPHNGYIVTTIRVICSETHKSAYWPMAAVTTLIPLLGVSLAILLISFGL